MGSPHIDKFREYARKIAELDIAFLSEPEESGEFIFTAEKPVILSAQNLVRIVNELPDVILQGRAELLATHTSALYDSMLSLSTFDTEGISMPERVRRQRYNKFSENFTLFRNTATEFILFLFSGASIAELTKNAELMLEKVSAIADQVDTKLEQINEAKAAIDGEAVKAKAKSYVTLFSGEASDASTTATIWICVTAAMAAITVIIAVWFILTFPIDATGGVLYQHIFGRVVGLFIPFSIAFWCGRNYRAFKHLEVTNKHRANAIASFEQFVNATKNDQIKDAVLMETTRAIFQHTGSGFIPSEDSVTPATSVIEILKGIGKGDAK